jgi:hypothetical protein
VGSDTWDRDYLDLVGPAFISIGSGGHGELAFGVVNAALDLSYGLAGVDFTFEGSDEGDAISGSGSAERLDDGTLEVQISFHHGDDATLTPERDPSSTAC